MNLLACIAIGKNQSLLYQKWYDMCYHVSVRISVISIGKGDERIVSISIGIDNIGKNDCYHYWYR